MRLYKISAYLPFVILLGQASNQAQTEITIPLGLSPSPAHDSYMPYHALERPRIALALSGGGTRGLAQIGVLKAFERHGLPVDCIAGTSMGAIIGGLYAAGYSAMELDSIARTVEWTHILQDAPPRQNLLMTQKESNTRHLMQFRLQRGAINFQNALSGGQRLNQLLNDLIWNAPYPIRRNFDELAIPFAAVCTDLLSGEKVVLREGSLVEAMRASMAIPLLFTPVKKEKQWLVDGGLLQNLPVEEARASGCGIVVAVNTTSPLRDPSKLGAPWEIADQVTTIMGRPHITQQLLGADIRIEPDLPGLTNTDMDNIESVILAGAQAAEAVIPKLDSLLAQSSPENSDILHQMNHLTISGNPSQGTLDILAGLSDAPPCLIAESRIRRIAQYMMQTGHISNVRAVLDTSMQRLTFHIEETPVIREIRFWGNTIFPDSSLIETIQHRPGDQIHLKRGRTDLQKLLMKYHQSGYSLARIEKAIVVGNALHIGLDEGIIRQLNITGNEVTMPFVIRRDLPLRPGDLFNIRQMSQALKDIYSTGYFKETGFDIQPKNEGYQLDLTVREHLFTLTRIGLRYDLERRIKGFLEIAKENVLGIAAEGAVTGYLGNRDQWVDLGLHADRIYTTQLTGKAGVRYGKSKYTYYTDNKSVGDYTFTYYRSSLDFGRQMQRLGTISLRLQTENIHILPMDEAVPLRDEKMIIQSIVLKSVVDSRDRMPFPAQGKYHHFEYETALGIFGSEVDYARIFSSMESYYPLHDRINFHPKIFWATADLTTPFPKHFAVGGLNGFMGLPDRALIGRRCLVFNSELRVRLPWPTLLESYLSLRYDFGGVWKSYSKIQSDDFKHGIGGILGLNTPLGPLLFGAGRMSDGYTRYYFSAGFEF